MTFILEGLSTQDQDDFAKGVPFIGDRFISRDNKKLRDKLNVVKRKMQRLFAHLGMLVYDDEFRRVLGPLFPPKEYNIPPVVRHFYH